MNENDISTHYKTIEYYHNRIEDNIMCDELDFFKYNINETLKKGIFLQTMLYKSYINLLFYKTNKEQYIKYIFEDIFTKEYLQQLINNIYFKEYNPIILAISSLNFLMVEYILDNIKLYDTYSKKYIFNILSNVYIEDVNKDVLRNRIINKYFKIKNDLI